MGVLTVSMTALRDAIVSSRQVRMALRGDLVHQADERRMRVSALCAGFASDRAGAHCAWFGPAAVRLSRRGLEETARAGRGGGVSGAGQLRRSRQACRTGQRGAEERAPWNALCSL